MDHRSLKTALISALMLSGAVAVSPASAGDADLMARDGVERVALEPLRLKRAELTVVGPNGETTYDGASLETLGGARLTSTTPWREEAATFEGVMLADLLAANGLLEVEAVRIIAENDYAVIVPRAVWTEHAALIATRVDGRAHSRRARGPLQIVFPMDADPATATTQFEQNWVWMAARIEPVE